MLRHEQISGIILSPTRVKQAYLGLFEQVLGRGTH
jgi:hypothetical protein